MMKIIFLCLCLNFLYHFSFSQSRADELKKRIDSSKNEQERIAACINFNDSFGIQDFDEMLRIANTGIELARSKKDSFSIAVLQRQVGESWYFKGKYDIAANHFYTSINILEKDGSSSKQLASSYNALAKLYRKTRDLERSLLNYDKAFTIFKQYNDSAGMAMIWNESGVVFEYAKDYDKAIARYNASLQMDRLLKDDKGVAYALGNLAGAYILQGKYELAEKNLLMALDIRKRMKDTFAIALNYSDLSSAYLSALDFSKAALYADSSNSIASKMGFLELKQNNFGLLADAAEQAGNFKTANDYNKKKLDLRDSIFGIEKTKQIEELNAKYDAFQNEKKRAELEHRIEKQKTILIAVAAMSFLVLLLAYTQYRRYKWKQEARMQAAVMQQQQQATKAVIEAEEAERQRIAKDLHDGVGQMMSAAKMNLSAYEDTVNFSSPDEEKAFRRIIQLVDESCSEVRSVSHNMMPNALVKQNLEAAIREFINKLDHRKLKVHLYAEGLSNRLDSNIETIVYRIIQECVNNVIKHSGADSLDISIIRDAKELTATIEDNGRGFDTTDKRTEDGIGLKNIRTRIGFLKGSVDFDTAPGRGTLVALHVPL